MIYLTPMSHNTSILIYFGIRDALDDCYDYNTEIRRYFDNFIPNQFTAVSV